MDSVDNFNGLSGHCPVSFWAFPVTLYIGQLMHIVKECPLSSWTLSGLSGLPGLCPGYPWTLSTDFPLTPWTMSRESMYIVQGAHGFSGHFTDGRGRSQ